MTICPPRRLAAGALAGLAPLARPALGQGRYPTRPVSSVHGRGRRHRRHGAHRRHVLEKSSASGQCGEPHRRLGRRRPGRHCPGGAGRLHPRLITSRICMMPCRSHRAEAELLPAPRPAQRGPARRAGERLAPYRDIKALAEAFRPRRRRMKASARQGGICTWRWPAGWGHGPAARTMYAGCPPTARARLQDSRGRLDIVTCSVPRHAPSSRPGAPAPRHHGPQSNPQFADVPT